MESSKPPNKTPCCLQEQVSQPSQPPNVFIPTLKMFLLSLEFNVLPETSVSTAPVASPPAAEEEEDDDPEVEDNDTPDLTNFTIDDMKQ